MGRSAGKPSPHCWPGAVKHCPLLLRPACVMDGLNAKVKLAIINWHVFLNFSLFYTFFSTSSFHLDSVSGPSGMSSTVKASLLTSCSSLDVSNTIDDTGEAELNLFTCFTGLSVGV